MNFSIIANLLNMHFFTVCSCSSLLKPIGAIHFLQICDAFVLDIEFVFEIE